MPSAYSVLNIFYKFRLIEIISQNDFVVERQKIVLRSTDYKISINSVFVEIFGERWQQVRNMGIK